MPRLCHCPKMPCLTDIATCTASLYFCVINIFVAMRIFATTFEDCRLRPKILATRRSAYFLILCQSTPALFTQPLLSTRVILAQFLHSSHTSRASYLTTYHPAFNNINSRTRLRGASTERV